MSGEVLIKAVKKEKPIFIDMIDSPYAYNETLKKYIYERGIDPNAPKVSKPRKSVQVKRGNGESPKSLQNYLQTVT